MRQHAHLPAMVGFVSKHVAQHIYANRPRLGPSVPEKLLNAAPAIKRLRKHLRTASGALGQACTGLLRRTARTVELCRNLQVRRRKPDPLGADIVHMREDRRNRANFARWSRSPRLRGKMFEKNLVDAVVDGKDLGRGSAGLKMNLVSTRSHGLPPGLILPNLPQSSQDRRSLRKEVRALQP
jgi:hypothetical protein